MTTFSEAALNQEVNQGYPEEILKKYVREVPITGNWVCARHPESPEKATGSPGRWNYSGVAAYYFAEDIDCLKAEVPDLTGREIYSLRPGTLFAFNGEQFSADNGSAFINQEKDGGWDLSQQIGEQLISIGISGVYAPSAQLCGSHCICLMPLDGKDVEKNIFEKKIS